MKKPIAIFCVLTVLLVLVSCAKEEPDPTPSVSPAEVSTLPSPEQTPEETPEESPTTGNGTIHEITDLIHTQTIDVSETHMLGVLLRYPRTGVEAIDDYYTMVCESEIEFGEMLAEELRSYNEQSDFALQYSLDNDYEIVKNSDDILSVHRTIYQYTGGVHGNHGDTCDNFRISDGTRLTLDDIFDCTQDEYVEDICRVFDKFIDDYSSGLEGYGFFPDAKVTLRDVFPTVGTFCITDTGLNFYLSPYFVTPYSSGTVVIPVSWDDLTVPRKEEFSMR